MAQQLNEAVQRLHFNTPSQPMRAKAIARIERNDKKCINLVSHSLMVHMQDLVFDHERNLDCEEHRPPWVLVLTLC